MNSEEYRRAIASVGLTQIAAAKFLGVDQTTSRRWATGRRPIPDAVAMLLQVMVSVDLRPGEVGQLMAGAVYDESLAKR